MGPRRRVLGQQRSYVPNFQNLPGSSTPGDDQLELEVIRDGETLRFFVGRERLRGFDPMFVLDEVVAMRFDVAFD